MKQSVPGAHGWPVSQKMHLLTRFVCRVVQCIAELHSLFCNERDILFHHAAYVEHNPLVSFIVLLLMARIPVPGLCCS